LVFKSKQKGAVSKKPETEKEKEFWDIGTSDAKA
jgi:hypothetical protein